MSSAHIVLSEKKQRHSKKVATTNEKRKTFLFHWTNLIYFKIKSTAAAVSLCPLASVFIQIRFDALQLHGNTIGEVALGRVFRLEAEQIHSFLAHQTGSPQLGLTRYIKS